MLNSSALFSRPSVQEQAVRDTSHWLAAKWAGAAALLLPALAAHHVAAGCQNDDAARFTTNGTSPCRAAPWCFGVIRCRLF